MKCNLLNENHNIAPNRYKSTKWGILPCDWGVAKLSDVFDHVSKKNADNSISNVLTNSATKGIVKQSEYFDKQIANDENTCNYFVVEQGDFVYNPRISSSAPCGPFKRYKGDEVGIMSPLYTVYRCKQSNTICSEYLEYYFDSSFWHKYMYSIANYGARSDRMSVALGDMDKMPIPNPPVEEQEKIAEILDAQDRIIQLKEKLLEEKKLQKKYLMQQLLTGKKRLPGFTDEWKNIKLGKRVCEQSIKNNDGKPREVMSVNNEVGFIEQFLQFEKVIASKDKSNYKIVKHNFFAYNPSRINVGSLSLYRRENEVIISPMYITFSVIDIDEIFLYYWFKSFSFNGQLKKYLEGSVRDSLSMNDLMQFDIVLPDVQEQKTIANVLSAKDHEIELIQKSIEQEKQKKKALMQLLLTGIVRTFK